MARLVADKHTEAVVRLANERRQAQWQKEVERTATPLLTWGGVADPTPAPPEIETVEDRLAMRLRRDERSFWKYDIGFRAKDAAERAAGRWYAYLCSLHPAAPPQIFERIVNSKGGASFVLYLARKTYARLIEGFPVEDDFEARPAPWVAIMRKHWLRLDDLPLEERRTGAWKAAMEAEIAEWKASHPEETAAWESWRAARDEREASHRVNHHDGRYAA